MQDSGRYSCQATNVAGKTEKNFNLNVWGEFTLFYLILLFLKLMKNKPVFGRKLILN